MSLHTCNQLCNDQQLHYLQKALGVDDKEVLKRILEQALESLNQ